jgi:UDP-GlcNAc:undecaprenyl-phosphate GlcNAc-1-phosphate transferase
MIQEFVLAFALSVVASVIVAPAVIRLAFRVKAIDQPGERKIHTRPIPRLGGLIVCTSFIFVTALAFHVIPGLTETSWMTQYRWGDLGVSVLLVVALGIWDDIHSLPAGRKLAVQIVVGNLVYFAGLSISRISIPFAREVIDLGMFAYPLTILWVVGITNAFNLIDGLDGLASGVALIASLTIVAVAGLSNDIATAMISLVLAGAILGFLPFNFNPARIFLGDSGSLFLGFVLAVLSIHSSAKGSTAFSILVPVLALGLPIMDTLLAMVRRVIRSFLSDSLVEGVKQSRLRAIFRPDKNHIHHRLLARGLSHKNAVIMLYLVSCIFGVCSFLVTTQSIHATVLLALIGMFAVVGVRKLGYQELAVLRNGMFLPIYDRPLMSRSLFHGCLDFLFIVLAILGAHLLTSDQGSETLGSTQVILTVLVAGGVQLCTFALGGIYKGTFRAVGLGDVLHTVKIVAIAVVLSFLATLLLPTSTGGGDRTNTFWIIDFYLLVSFVAGARLSFHVLNFLFRSGLKGGKRVLIYGADSMGLITLQRILNHDAPALVPVGFLDEDAALEGKSLNGYPIYGGHWKLDMILKRMKIQEIIFSCEMIKPEVFRRVRSAARAHGVSLREARIRLEELPGSFSSLQPSLAPRSDPRTRALTEGGRRNRETVTTPALTAAGR